MLDTRQLATTSGTYLVWDLQGDVTIRVTNLDSGLDAVVNAVFFGGAADGSSASFVGADTTTQGNWRDAYGGDGYDIAQDTSVNNPSLPSYAQVSMTGESNYSWGTTYGDVDPLENAAGTGTIAAFWYSNTTFDININLTDGQAHEVALYETEAWAGERLDVIDDATGVVVDSQQLAATSGTYLVWDLQGDATIRVTNLDPSLNGIVNGIFFGGAADGSSASFVGADTTTQGNWRNAYGGDGYDISQDTSGNNPSLPSYAQVSMTGESNYSFGTTYDGVDPLEDAAGTGTIAAFWYSNTTFDININLTDGQAHEVALYETEAWAGERLDVIDDATGVVVDSQQLAATSGTYLVWDLQGDVTIRVTNFDPSLNAVVNGIFFGGASDASSASFLAPTRRPRGTGVTPTAATATTSPRTRAATTPACRPMPRSA